MAKDPVCSMMVDEKMPAAKMEYEGNVYYFCCTTCLAWIIHKFLPQRHQGTKKQ